MLFPLMLHLTGYYGCARRDDDFHGCWMFDFQSKVIELLDRCSVRCLSGILFTISQLMR